jgi:hypothetical protein
MIPTRTETEPRLLSRVVLTWLELTIVGIVGASVGTFVGGPPGLIVYFATALVSIGVLFHNINELVTRRLAVESDSF